MNYYERIQRSLTFMDDHLLEEISLEDIADRAFMSVSNFYRLFYAFTGYRVMEYLRLRRLSHAAWEISPGNRRVVDVALQSGFESPEAFTRAFKKVYGCSPREYRGRTDREQRVPFERINLMERYFDGHHDEGYPDIKVIKDLPPMRLAACRGKGDNAELDALAKLVAWAKANGQWKPEEGRRIFGYDNGLLGEKHEYGFMMTVDEQVVEDDVVVIRTLSGGRYAVMSTLLEDITGSWRRFREWLANSRYQMGRHQWLEEHLLDGEQVSNNTRLDLYMPVEEKTLRPTVQPPSHEAPRLIEKEQFRVIGMSCHTGAEDNQKHQTTAKLWDRFNIDYRKIDGLSNLDGVYGVISPLPNENPMEKWEYMTAAEVQARAHIPQGMVEKTIPASQYAVFTYRSPSVGNMDFRNLASLWGFIFGQWLLQSPYQYNFAARTLEYYQPVRMNQAHPEFEIWIPIRPKDS